MKKIIIGVLALAVIGIVGIAGVISANATATNGPNMTIQTSTTQIDTYKGMIFETDIKINTGVVTSTNGDPDNVNYILKGGKLKLDNVIDFELISANIVTKDFNQANKPEGVVKEFSVTAKNNEINLGDLTYVYTGTSGGTSGDLKYNMQGPSVDVKLKIKAKNIEQVDRKLNDLLKVTYSNYDGNKDVGTFDKDHHEVPINVSEVVYEIGTIKGEGESNRQIPSILGKYFELLYVVDPGVLTTNDSKPVIPDTGEERNLVYVVDANVIDKVGGNEESARVSMIAGLEKTKESNPDTTASLVVYDENAEIVKVNDKTVFTISDLINEISKIESSEKSGNIGDAIRKTQLLVNETDGKDSVVIVSGGDSNYYTQVSEGNSLMLSTRVEKEGFVVEDKEKANEYANNVVNDIVVNEEDETRWLAINYALENEEVLVNNLIEKLEGKTLDVVKPYYDNFISINEIAVAPFVIKATLETTVGKNDIDSIEVHPDDKKQELDLVFNKKGNLITSELKNLKVRVKVNDMNSFTEDELDGMGKDVANPQNLMVKLVVPFGEGKPKEYIFNSPNNELETDEILCTWYVKPSIPYVAQVGLFNGMFTLPKGTLTTKEVAQDVRNIEAIASRILEVAPEFDLAEDNHFGLGFLIKSQSEGDTFEVITRLNEDDKSPTVLTEGVKLYELNEERFILSEDKTLNPNKIYLVTVDYFIDGKTLGRMPGQAFEIGVNVTTNNILEKTELQDIELKTERKTEFWGIEVNVVDKPEHF
ncbi:MAG: hypothetical protein ACRCWG_09980 [Sarcina sp.]